MTGFDDIWYDADDVAMLKNELAMERSQADYYREAYSDTARSLLQSEDVGWNRLGVSADIYQISLTQAKQVARQLDGYTDSNPLLSRGHEIRCSYLLSEPYAIGTKGASGKVSAQQLNTILRDRNQEAVFGMAALERIARDHFTAGQAFLLYDTRTKLFQHIPILEIGDIIYDPDDSSVIRYVMREWTAHIVNADGTVAPVTEKIYYPSSKFDGPFVPVIKGVEVEQAKRMVVDRVNTKSGANLGIPDSFAAAPWALAYSAYLSDGSKVLAALAEWAWQVKPKRANPAGTAASTVRSTRGAGGTIVSDMEVTSLPRANAVDLGTGRPLAAQVASALGISVVLLLADPGQSGAYGTAQTLSDPNRRTMEARQEKFSALLNHCLNLIGVKDADITWPKMAPGSDADEMSIVMQGWGSGLMHDDELRPRIAELANITLLHSKPPTGFMYPNNSNSLDRIDVDNDAGAITPQSAANAANKTASSVNPDGSTSQSNGQGRDSLGVGNLSHAKKSNKTAPPATGKA